MYYLLKTEPTVYGFADLQKEQSTIWDGVTNPVVVKNLRGTQKGDKLIFSNRGSDPQGGALNACLSAWKGGIISMLASTMLFDQMFALEGAIRNLEFDVEPGTISCATRPAAVDA